MLKVQEYLLSGKTHDDLTAELGIEATYHDYLPLVILNYSQIESPKVNKIVRECRALVLNSQTHDLVAKSFSRFFNWGEVQDEMALFDFTDFSVQTKEDGSLVLIYNYNGDWFANTRGSFGLSTLQGDTKTWQERFCEAMHISHLNDLSLWLDPAISYVCEFCSPFNKIVRRYPTPTMFLLTAFRGEQELSVEECDKIAKDHSGIFQRPEQFHFKSLEDIQAFLTKQSESDPTYEGVVIRDVNHRRYKIKSPTYLGLHKLRGESDNLFNPKHLLPFILAGEEDELLTYFEEVRGVYFEYKSQVQAAYIKLVEVWYENHKIESQKDFALSILDKTPFSPILFEIRKRFGSNQELRHLKQTWREQPETILKVLWRKK